MGFTFTTTMNILANDAISADLYYDYHGDNPNTDYLDYLLSCRVPMLYPSSYNYPTTSTTTPATATTTTTPPQPQPYND
jgi:hypothetical protein